MTLDKRFDPKATEEKLYKEWERSGAFACDPESAADPYTIMMPPPNVTGSLHIGHALTMTLQDILTRYQRMKGRDALWQPGTDHAGIATQMVVERMLDSEGLERRKIGRDKFLERVWKWKEESGGTITNQLKRLGTTPDWKRERFTMDAGLSDAVIKVFVQLYNEKLIYKDVRLVNWDPKLKTAISDLEVEQREQKGSMWHIRYPVAGDTERFITVATTRPETMFGDMAVAVHPHDDRYKDMVGLSVCLPITGRMIPIIADEYADMEKGSGAVKITPAHDFNDFDVGKRHNLPMMSVLDRDACVIKHEDIPNIYHGLDRFEARKVILKELDEQDLLAEVEKVKNAVPYGDRSGVVIEPYLTEQWYCDAPTLAKPALRAVKTGKTKFVPQTWENTYFHWMENIQPWCISRQLWWGHQIPAWYDEDGNVYVAENEEKAQKQAGKGVTLTRDEDVLDTWFSSALWPFSTLGWPEQTPELHKYFPGDVLVTGFDIIFFWVARMIMMSYHFMGDTPFHTIYMHALVRDASGKKMSKSKGNVMDPLDLIDQYGTDALRFTLTAMAAQGRDIKLSESRIEGYRNFTTKLWNAARYCEMNGCKPVPNFDPSAVSYSVNQWIVGEVIKLEQIISFSLRSYKFNETANGLYHFIWGTFCDWYLEMTKPVLSDNADSDVATEIRATTAWVLDQILTMLNPIMPYITEELYAAFARRPHRLISSLWPDYSAVQIDEDAAKKISWLIRIVSEIRSVRADMNVPAGAKIPLLVKGACDNTKDGLDSFADIIKRMARLKSIDLTDETPKGAIQTVIDQTTLILPIADIIDLDAERARLRKQIEKLDEDIKKVEQKLSNERFVNNAPQEIIDEQHLRKVEALGVKEKLSAALAQLDTA